ncbi:Uncharacterized protein HZ326_12965 [Fusarium oxysporum f. sp. albedinis]|nr:Uncharacterized protein HZ326_12965 [Fusarium oxysporum f. sp. albedinis]
MDGVQYHLRESGGWSTEYGASLRKRPKTSKTSRYGNQCHPSLKKKGHKFLIQTRAPLPCCLALSWSLNLDRYLR